MNNILGSVISVSNMTGSDEGDLSSLKRMLIDARTYLLSFKWCKCIQREYLGYGIGDVVALFLFEIENLASPDDSYLWVVVGDLPSAYFVLDDACNPEDALCVYLGLMDEWATTVLSDLPTEDCFPVKLPSDFPKKEAAEMLTIRLDFLKNKILPDVALRQAQNVRNYSTFS